MSSTTTTHDAPTTGQKFAAEALGTFVLVFFGCGAAIRSGLVDGDLNGYVVTGLAFGFAVVVMSYAVGRVSGGHFNPAITLGATLGGRLPWRLAGVYVAAQLLGGLLAGAALFSLLQGFESFSAEGNMWQNFFGDEGSGFAWWAALLLEALMTMILVWVVLGVTDARNELQAVMGPLAIGLALAMIHFASMSVTGTSVNPARSIGVGVFAGTDAIVQLWLFIVAPVIGGVIAGLTYPLLFGHGQEQVPGSGLSFGGGRRNQPVPGGYEAQWNQGQVPPQGQWGQLQQQWGAPAAPPQQHWGAPDPSYGAPQQAPQQWGATDPAYGAPQAPPQSPPGQWGQPAPQPGATPGVAPGAPGAPGHWGNPEGDDDGRTQVRRPD